MSSLPEFIVYLWLFPVVIQILLPLLILVIWGSTRFISAQLRNQRQKRRDIMAFAPTRMQLKSDAFKQDTLIPSRFTGEGEDVSPALAWD